MDAEEAAWCDQRTREEGFIDLAIDYARDLHAIEQDTGETVELDIETGIPTQCHEIPVEVTDFHRSFRADVLGDGGAGAGGGGGEGAVDEINADADSGGAAEACAGATMYEKNNITMLPIIQAELGSTNVVSAIVDFFVALRIRVCGMSADSDADNEGDSKLDSDGEEEISENIMERLGVWTWCDGSPARAMLQQQREGHYNFPGGFHTVLEVRRIACVLFCANMHAPNSAALRAV